MLIKGLLLTLYILRWSLELLLIYIEIPVPNHQNTSSLFGNCSQSVVVFFLHFITTFGSFTTVGQFRIFHSFIWTINNRWMFYNIWTINNNLVMYNIWTRLTIVWSFTTFGQFSTFELLTIFGPFTTVGLLIQVLKCKWAKVPSFTSKCTMLAITYNPLISILYTPIINTNQIKIIQDN
jgi:hypothetical protein